MADVISFEDVVSIYQGCLLVRKGVLVKFEEAFIYADKIKARLYVLSTGKIINVLFRVEDFKAPKERIGYVNIDGHAIRISRYPKRLYKAGLHSTNVEFSCPPHPHSADGSRRKVVELSKFVHSAIVDAYANEYPSLKDAAEQAKASHSSVAFDKQFAVSCLGAVFYKDSLVGKFENNVITFKDDRKYLYTLLDKNYEKASRNFAPESL